MVLRLGGWAWPAPLNFSVPRRLNNPFLPQASRLQPKREPSPVSGERGTELAEVLTEGVEESPLAREGRVPWMKDSDNVFAGGLCIRLSTRVLNAREYILELQPPRAPNTGDYLGQGQHSRLQLYS